MQSCWQPTLHSGLQRDFLFLLLLGTWSWASGGFSLHSSSLAESLTVPGTEEALCKDVSNEERKALQVQSVGLAPRVGVLVAGKVGVANPVSQR